MGKLDHIIIGKPSVATAKKLAANLGLSERVITSQIAKIPHIGLDQPQPVPHNPYSARILEISRDYGRDLRIIPDAAYNLLGTSLGNPVWANLTIQGGSYTDLQGKTITYPRVDFEAVLITVTIPKRIIKTEIQGRDDTVKEYIGRDDAQLSIAGIITGTNGSYPVDAVNQLYEVINAPVALGVVCAYLQNLNIHSIVVESADFPQEEGGYSYQQFSINAVSDTPQELRIGGV